MNSEKVCVIEARHGGDEFFEATVLLNMETGAVLKEYHWLGRTVHWWLGKKAGPVINLGWQEAREYLALGQIPPDKIYRSWIGGGSTTDYYLEATRFLNRAGASEAELEKFMNMVANLLLRAESNRRTAEFMSRENNRMRDQSWFLADIDCDFVLQAADQLDCGQDCQHKGYEPDTNGSWCNLEDQGGICGGSLSTELRDLYVRIQWAKEKSKWYLRLLGLPTSLKSGFTRILEVRRKTN